MDVVFKPLPGKVVVKTIDPSTKQYITDSNLILVDFGNEKPQYGQIIATYEPFVAPGDDEDDETEPFLKVGQEVIFGRFSGVKVRINREDYLILRETEILSVLEFASDDKMKVLENPVPLPGDFQAESQHPLQRGAFDRA